jgi:prepilin-type N-terminal cleavage/methylation domain-containing protein/prepilin-type processing-associated H-X9-DG protein
MPARQRDRGRTLRGFTFVELLVVTAVMCVLVSLLLPATAMVREAARRTRCKENLLQIGTALGSYHVAHATFPPGVVTDWYSAQDHTRDRPTHWRLGASWMVLILPQMGEQAVYNAFNSELPVRSAGNETVVGQFIATYVCPSASLVGAPGGRFTAPSTGYGGTTAAAMAKGNYAGNWGAGTYAWADRRDPRRCGLFGQSSGTRTEDIRDGTANTLAAAEIVPVDHPADCRGAWAYGGMGGSALAVPRAPTTPPSPTASPAPIATTWTDRIPFGVSRSDRPCTTAIDGTGHAAPASWHGGVGNLLYVDGSVRSGTTLALEDMLTIAGGEY